MNPTISEFSTIDDVGKRYRFKTDTPIIGDVQGLLLTNYQYAAERNAYKIISKLGVVKIAELCSGVGGGTLFLARELPKVYAVDMDETRLMAAKINATNYGVIDKITFINGDAMDSDLLKHLKSEGVQAVVTDVGWREDTNLPIKQTTTDLSKTIPPAPELLSLIRTHITENVIMRLPLTITLNEIRNLGLCEIEKMFYDDIPRFYNVYFGNIVESFEARDFHMK